MIYPHRLGTLGDDGSGAFNIPDYVDSQASVDTFGPSSNLPLVTPAFTAPYVPMPSPSPVPIITAPGSGQGDALRQLASGAPNLRAGLLIGAGLAVIAYLLNG